MGTNFQIVLYAVDSAQATEAASKVRHRIEELEAVLSDYREDSELLRVARNAYLSPQVLSPDLFSVLEKSLWFSRISHGAFDITIGPLSELWRTSRESGQLPDTESLNEAAARVGYRNLLLNPRTRSLRFRRPGIEMDLGGIGKGFAADEALDVLLREGIASALVSAGGDIRVGQPPPDAEGWRVELELGGEERRAILLGDTAIASSGDLFQFVEIERIRYSHIIDPGTSKALIGPRIATVIAPEAMMADAIATALSVLGPEAGFALLEELEGVEAQIVLSVNGTNTIYRSEGFPQ
jgi:thiamine biosynthesis lipoprotein